MKHQVAIWIMSAGMAVLSNGLAAQEYPSRPIRIAASSPGGGQDFQVRLLAPMLVESLGQPVVIENQKNPFTAYDAVRRAAPDGYTLLIGGSSLWVEPLFSKVSWDFDRDYSLITLITTQPAVLVVNASSPVRSVGELIAFAKGKPGVLNYASGGTRSANHIATELLKSLAGVDIVRIPYAGAAAAMRALAANEVQVMFGTSASVAPLIKTGRLRAIAVSSAEPSELLPGVPTVSTTVPGFEQTSLNAMLVPAKTPSMIVQRLNRAFLVALKNPEVKQKLNGAGLETLGTTSEQAVNIIRADRMRLIKMVKEGGVDFSGDSSD